VAMEEDNNPFSAAALYFLKEWMQELPIPEGQMSRISSIPECFLHHGAPQRSMRRYSTVGAQPWTPSPSTPNAELRRSPTSFDSLRLTTPRDPTLMSVELLHLAFVALHQRLREGDANSGSPRPRGWKRHPSMGTSFLDPVASSPAAESYIMGGAPRESSVMLNDLRVKMDELALIHLQTLDHETRLAFWLNVLNAATLANLAHDSRRLPNRHKFVLFAWLSFLQRNCITVDGTSFTLYEIEKLVLNARTSSPAGFKWSVSQEKEPPAGMSLKKSPEVTFGIGYPLRAGCPPLRVYRAVSVKTQLLINCAHYIVSTLKTDVRRRRVWLPALFRHYHRDFPTATSVVTSTQRCPVEFARATLNAVPDAIESICREARRNCGAGRTSKEDRALAEDCLAHVANLDKLRSTSGDTTPFAGVDVRFAEFDRCFDFQAKKIVCPELQEIHDHHFASATEPQPASPEGQRVIRRLHETFDISVMT